MHRVADCPRFCNVDTDRRSFRIPTVTESFCTFCCSADLLQKIVDNKMLTMKGVVGLFPANAVGDDVELYADDEDRSEVIGTFCMLRQQMEKENDDSSLDPCVLVGPAP